MIDITRLVAHFPKPLDTIAIDVRECHTERVACGSRGKGKLWNIDDLLQHAADVYKVSVPANEVGSIGSYAKLIKR